MKIKTPSKKTNISNMKPWTILQAITFIFNALPKQREVKNNNLATIVEYW